MRTRYLTRQEREEGQKYFYRFSARNGVGFSFLGDTPVYLMAVHFGATNIQLGMISALIHASGIVLLFVPCPCSTGCSTCWRVRRR